MKPVRYALHAEVVTVERGLDKAWVERTVRDPQWVERDPAGHA